MSVQPPVHIKMHSTAASKREIWIFFMISDFLIIYFKIIILLVYYVFIYICQIHVYQLLQWMINCHRLYDHWWRLSVERIYCLIQRLLKTTQPPSDIIPFFDKLITWCHRVAEAENILLCDNEIRVQIAVSNCTVRGFVEFQLIAILEYIIVKSQYNTETAHCQS